LNQHQFSEALRGSFVAAGCRCLAVGCSRQAALLVGTKQFKVSSKSRGVLHYLIARRA
jgi:hypothetical protein